MPEKEKQDLPLPPLVEVDPDATLPQALALMKRHRIHHLVVKQGDQLKGILSYHNVVEAQLNHGFPPLSDLKVSDAATTDVPVVDETMGTRQAVRLMLTHGHTALLLQDRGRTLGLVTETDLLRLLDRMLERHTPGETIKQYTETVLANPLVQNISRFLAGAGI